MDSAPPDAVYYKRSRFSTRLPADRLYTPSHYWISLVEQGICRVGLTKFATRMLGDLVEYEFKVRAGDAVRVGQVLGWIEGFKAVADIYSVAGGTFGGACPLLAEDITLVDSDPYGKGWLYSVRGEPDRKAVNVHGYIAVLDATIDRMLQKESETKAHE